ncbi:glycosyltransferase family 2 protein [Roseomonas sp. KE2513]|uniref:glycosyltransferase family 2 protein n=1 Tax=Roseomonas sp. KE2513 TaxID=2479202 RepID=UPI0018DFBD70|nr:glycosyltransferase family 2 protein [Roseomonas sp. KE2513]MBI0536637.1 glycosyltransferase family 2 protein [Roseomonas sp. KE2513]
MSLPPSLPGSPASGPSETALPGPLAEPGRSGEGPGSAPAISPEISVVVPVRNEAPNIVPLVAEITAALAGVPHEIVYVDDGSTDGTAEAVREAARSAPVRLLRHATSCGQSAAVVSGVRAARAPWIATLDGDGQNDPADIPRLWARARTEGKGALVAGWRKTRKDTTTKRLTSRIANRVRARLLGDATPDTGCGLKVFARDLFLSLPHFDHMHRFLPALVLRGGGRVVSEPVGHRPRVRGVSNYGTLDRLAVGIVDLLGMMWLQRRWKRPRLLPEDATHPGAPAA